MDSSWEPSDKETLSLTIHLLHQSQSTIQFLRKSAQQVSRHNTLNNAYNGRNMFPMFTIFIIFSQKLTNNIYVDKVSRT